MAKVQKSYTVSTLKVHKTDEGSHYVFEADVAGARFVLGSFPSGEFEQRIADAAENGSPAAAGDDPDE